MFLLRGSVFFSCCVISMSFSCLHGCEKPNYEPKMSLAGSSKACVRKEVFDNPVVWRGFCFWWFGLQQNNATYLGLLDSPANCLDTGPRSLFKYPFASRFALFFAKKYGSENKQF